MSAYVPVSDPEYHRHGDASANDLRRRKENSDPRAYAPFRHVETYIAWQAAPGASIEQWWKLSCGHTEHSAGGVHYFGPVQCHTCPPSDEWQGTITNPGRWELVPVGVRLG